VSISVSGVKVINCVAIYSVTKALRRDRGSMDLGFWTKFFMYFRLVQIVLTPQ
jgi:hypothetical protein